MLDFVVHGFVGIGSVLLGGHARALLFCESDTIAVGDLILNAAVRSVIDNLVQVDQALHTTLSLWLQLHFIFFRVCCHDQAPVLFSMFL